jgi:hypothetical protein
VYVRQLVRLVLDEHRGALSMAGAATGVAVVEKERGEEAGGGDAATAAEGRSADELLPTGDRRAYLPHSI